MKFTNQRLIMIIFRKEYIFLPAWLSERLQARGLEAAPALVNGNALGYWRGGTR